MDTGSFIKRLYGQGRAFKGTSDGEADRDLSRTSPVPYSPDERSFYRYPFDLGEAPENQNFMVFDIYENDGEGLKSVRAEGPNFAGGATGASIIAKGADFLANRVPDVITGGVVAKTVANAAAGFGLIEKESAASVSNFVKDYGGIAKNVNFVTSGVGRAAMASVSRAVDAVSKEAGRGEEGFIQESLGLGGQLKRAKKTIFLYMPGGLNSNYGLKYGESADFKNLGMMAVGIGGGVKGLMSMATNGSVDPAAKAASDALAVNIGMGAVKEIEDKLQANMKDSGLEGDLNLKKFVEASSRRAQNPFAVQLFEAVDRRNFEYDFSFHPKSKKEVDEVYCIMRTFKRYAFPAKSLGGRYLDYPAEFRISFIHKDKENLYLNRFARCALTGIDIKYGESPFTTFIPDSGGAAPTSYTMKLKFTELEILTQDRIDQGF